MFVKASLEKSNSSAYINRKKQQPFFSPVRIQPKLTIGAVDDPYEREADAVADKVMRMSDTETLQTKTSPIKIQGKCKHCEEEEKLQRKEDDEDNQILYRQPIADLPVQRKCAACQKEEKNIQLKKSTSSSIPDVAPSVNHVLQSSGHSLEMGTRSFMESRFGYDFSDVQIHNDSLANQSAADINACAYTYGQHIVFGKGQYQQNTYPGRLLLAHELTHVVQQSPDTIKRQPVPHTQKDISRADEIKLSITSPGAFDVSAHPITISIFNFGINKFGLKTEHKTVLDTIAFLLKKLPHDKWTILVEGDADITGTKAINDPLSKNRANEVKKYLRLKSGESFPAIGFGAELPITTNENVSGRTRNRRVDILFFPPFIKKPVCENPPCEEKKPNPCDNPLIAKIFCKGGFPCVDAGWLESIICIGLLCLLTPLSEFCACALDPLECLPSRKSKKKKKKACPILVNLPSGNLPMHNQWPLLGLRQPFTMRVVFSNDDTGCDCSCGEYKQEVKGFFETEFMNGRIENTNDNNPKHWKRFTPTTRLEPDTFHEDGSGNPDSEYGHRSHPGRTGTQISKYEWDVIDFFSPMQSNGCLYRGQDNPGFQPLVPEPDERRRTYHLEFKGSPVTAGTCSGDRSYLPGYVHTWTVSGSIVRPPEVDIPDTGPTPGGKGPGGPTQTGKVKAIPATPRITSHKGDSPVPAVYEGGLPIDAPEKSVQNITISFDVEGSQEPYYYTIKVLVLKNNADSIKIRTTNNYSLNLAPYGKPEIILSAHKVVTISKSILK